MEPFDLKGKEKLIEVDSDFGKIIGFTSDKFDSDSYLYLDKKYFVVICENEIFGSCSWVKEKNEFTWGIFFKDGVNPIISSVCVYLFLENCFFNEEINILGSLVKKENSGAFSFNKNFGFKIYKEDEEYFYLKLEKESWENNKNSRLIKSIKKYLDKIEYQFS